MSKTTTLADIVSSNGTLIVPTGTTAGRPSATAGSIRFNTDLNTLESANGSAWANVGSGAASSGGGVSWNSTVQTSNFIAISGTGYGVNTATNPITVTLPATPTSGQYVQFVDYGGTFSANNLTIYGNGNKIQGNTSNVILQNSSASLSLVYFDTNKGWVTYAGSPSSVIGPYLVDYLVVAGGGGAGGAFGGGGGAGGLISGSSVSVTPGSTYTITVGAGGGGGSIYNLGNNGSNSSALGYTGIGGGGGSVYGTPPNSGPAPSGKSGGSGGGGATNEGTGTSPGGSGTVGQGNPGGSGYSASPYVSGGGGGAGASGTNATGAAAGPGGAGSSSSITGTSVTYAGGGGGGAYTYSNGSTAGTGGSGGGGPGTGSQNGNGTSGSSNTGGGGGGGGYSTGTGGSGGSGVVIIRYFGIQKGSGGTISSSGGYTIHTFTSSGTFTA